MKENMDEMQLHRLKCLRDSYDLAISECDPIEFAVRQKRLVHDLAEFLLFPLQEYELAERSKFKTQCDISSEDETDDIS